MPLKEELTQAMKTAMREKQKLRLGTIRMALAAIKQVEIDDKKTLDDGEIIKILTKLIKQRKESAKQYTEAQRNDLAEQELSEITVLEDFMPQMLDQAAIEQAVRKAVEESGASSVKDTGKVMGLLKAELAGKADMGLVSQCVKAALSA